MGLGKTFVGAEKMYLLNNDVNLVVCQKSKIDDWIEHFQTYYPEYSIFDLTNKNQAVRFRELIETDKFYDYGIQIVGVINWTYNRLIKGELARDRICRDIFISEIRK